MASFDPVSTKTPIFMRFAVILTAIAIIIPLGVAAYTVWGGLTLVYELTPTAIDILYGPRQKTIDRDTVHRVYKVDGPTRARRYFGTNAPGMKQGTWSFAETGRITLYATSTKELVVIETADGRWGINPEHPRRFIEQFENGHTGSFQPDPKPGTGPLVAITALVFAVVGVPLYFVTAYTRRILRRLRYEVTDDAFVIHGGRHPTIVPLTRIDDVRVADPRGIPIRTFGIGMPGLHWGAYAWRDAGPNLRLYATRLRPLVLVSTDRETFGITPKDADRFVDTLTGKLKA